MNLKVDFDCLIGVLMLRMRLIEIYKFLLVLEGVSSGTRNRKGHK